MEVTVDHFYFVRRYFCVDTMMYFLSHYLWLKSSTVKSLIIHKLNFLQMASLMKLRVHNVLKNKM